jgi:hypothetical protein
MLLAKFPACNIPLTFGWQLIIDGQMLLLMCTELFDVIVQLD